jgi:hypothetical protein
MRTNRTTLTAAVLAAVGVCALGAGLVARASGGSGPHAAAIAPQADAAPKKPEPADQSRLRSELDGLLKQRAGLDRRIADLRGKLGETGKVHRRIELRDGNGQPQIFEFDGDGYGNVSPETRKQLEDMQKRMEEAFGNMQFGDLPNFDFQFIPNGPNGSPDMKAFRDRMQKWGQQFRDRAQQRPNGAPGKAPGSKSGGGKPESAPPKIKTLDA